MSTWILIDSHYQCYRHFFTRSHLSYKDVPTGAVFGFLQDLVIFRELFDSNRMVFCFDYGDSKRQQWYPPYKSNRKKKKDPEMQKAFNDLQLQIEGLRESVLPSLGYQNIFYQDGYEADDIIASICHNLYETDEAVIISSDKDLLQLLSPDVRIFDPMKKRIISYKGFRKQYGIDPNQWASVRAMAGCSTDNIRGIDGVGEVTALRYLKKELNPQSAGYRRIVSGQIIIDRNLPLVQLPYKGTKKRKLKRNKLQKSVWKTIVNEMGMKSLQYSYPG
jgi:DNA polymerase I